MEVVKDIIYDKTLKYEPAFRGSEIISFNKFQSWGDNGFLYDKRIKKIIIYNKVTGKTQTNTIPKHTYNEFIEFYVDPITGKSYLFKFDKDNNGVLYNYNWKTNEYTSLLKTKYLVRGVFDGKLYISGRFDDTYAHYLIPIKGENKNIILMEENDEILFNH